MEEFLHVREGRRSRKKQKRKTSMTEVTIKNVSVLQGENAEFLLPVKESV